MIHIQNRAPGPPKWMAIATPAMLPIPTVADSAVVRLESADDLTSAWTEDAVPLSRTRNPDGTETVVHRAPAPAAAAPRRFMRLRVRLRP